MRMERLISWREIQRHNKADDAWIVIDGKVLTIQLISNVVAFSVIRRVTKIKAGKRTNSSSLPQPEAGKYGPKQIISREETTESEI